MPKIITILARIDNRPDAVIVVINHCGLDVLFHYMSWVMLRIKALVLPNLGMLPPVAMLIVGSPAKNVIFVE